MSNLLKPLCGTVFTKSRQVLTKEAPIKRGDTVELNLNFVAASLEEMTKAIGPDTPEGYIAGWASTKDRDLYNHEVVAGAFQQAIDMRGLSGPRGIKLLLDHEWTRPAGVITVLEYRRGNLWMEAQMNLDVEYARERWQMLKMMGGANFSVGFMLQDYDIVEREIDGDEDWFLRINRGDLFEVSIVLFPGNEACEMTFVKAALHEDNPSEDELFFAKSKVPMWKMSASRNLPIIDTDAYDSAAAKARMFKAANFDTDKPDLDMIKKGFLVHDASNPTLKSSYKLAIADIVDGKLVACSAGVAAAVSRVGGTDVPDTVKLSARSVLDFYQEQHHELVLQTKTAPQSLSEFEKALVANGLAKSRNDAREITRVAKSCPQLFQKQTENIHEHTQLDNGSLTEIMSNLKKMKDNLSRIG